ncbi:MAG: hypothetical protein ABR924_18915 [Terracidiphilus sp.]|jgi:hypothetical protein
MNDALRVFKVRMPSFTDIVDGVEHHLVEFTTTTVKFLDEHPGIAMVLSPTTITRQAARKHIDRILNQ